MKKLYIVIPALEPETELIHYIHELKICVGGEIIVVDDGSGPEYQHIFRKISDVEGCTVLHHRKNQGKGQALKTAFRYIHKKVLTKAHIVCTDCDGQHTASDIIGVLKTVEAHPDSLVLGVRDFSESGVPARSIIGNRGSSLMFWLKSGQWINDTQTGLRAFENSLLSFMMKISGDRFEYEMEMLSECVKHNICIYTTKIQTIYKNGNRGSHFRPVSDSIRVMKTFFGSFIKYFISSIICAAIDICLFCFFVHVFMKNNAVKYPIVFAALSARIVSASVNFIINRFWVFSCRKKCLAGIRYIFLCVAISFVSSFLVSGLSFLYGKDPVIVKIGCDLLLFMASYIIQKNWVFSHRKAELYGK